MALGPDFTPLLELIAPAIASIVLALLAVGVSLAGLATLITGYRKILYIIQFRQSEHYADWRKANSKRD